MIDLDRSYVNRLLYFYFVASCKNITKAARETGLHQSAMSRQMLKLEKDIGMSLMKRHSDGITLTRKGEELFESAERIYNEIQITRKKLNETEEISGKIKICSSYAMINYLLAEPLLEFQKLYPTIELEIIGNDEIIDIVKSNVDVVICPYDSQNEDVIQEPLFKLQAKLYASAAYIEKNGFPKTLEELGCHKFIARSRTELLPYAPTSINWFLNIEECTTERNRVLSTNAVETAFQAAEEGLGILSSYDNMKILKDSNLINVVPDAKGPIYNVYFICSQRLDKFTRVNMLRKWLKEYFDRQDSIFRSEVKF